MEDHQWEALIEIRTQQGVALTTLTGIVQDHEKRLRSLERYIGWAIGAIGLAMWAIERFLK